MAPQNDQTINKSKPKGRRAITPFYPQFNANSNPSKRQQQNKSIKFDIQQQLLQLDSLSQKVHDGLTELGDESPLKTTINEFLDVFNAVKPALRILTPPQNRECISMPTPITTKIPQQQRAPSNKNNNKTHAEVLSSKEESGKTALAKQQHHTTNSKKPSRLAANNNNIRQRSIVVYGLAESKEKLPSKRATADITKATKLLDLLGIEAIPSIHRLGVPNPTPTGPRPILITFSAVHIQRLALKEWKANKSELRERDGWKDLMVRIMLSPAQLAEEEQKLRRNLKRKIWPRRRG